MMMMSFIFSSWTGPKLTGLPTTAERKERGEHREKAHTSQREGAIHRALFPFPYDIHNNKQGTACFFYHVYFRCCSSEKKNWTSNMDNMSEKM